ncbi:hypothetical protein CYMTET_29973 [Cymbomonas tetramitiformis]|uniref:Phospholipase/carboxylesterase/thioesterase domain-containing protein n=1 Tax=Cymbomonas tetramitiformis TaxID=36881 RepID=A0AAE0KUD5_9CHLO|nr:hypothetical protein CYMTET_29973 [Cymbomonas tetramitiformis]
MRALGLEPPMRYSRELCTEVPTWCDVSNPRVFSLEGCARCQVEDFSALAEIEDSCRKIHTVLQDLVDQGTQPSRIALLGFGLGGGCAVHAGLTAPIFGAPLAGVVSIGGGVPFCGYLAEKKKKKPAGTPFPVILVHGMEDTLAEVAYAKRGLRAMEECGVPARLHVVAGGLHEVGAAEYAAAAASIRGLLDPLNITYSGCGARTAARASPARLAGRRSSMPAEPCPGSSA